MSSSLSQLTQSSAGGEKAETIIELDAPLNGKVYLVGTAHFSVESNREVAELIRKVKPNRVVIELCKARSNILKLDEETVLREAKEMDMNKIMQMIKQVIKINGPAWESYFGCL